jgi:2-(1,2-epoxy-1,2-dihydrophenyl)acetyl-CoA isomerase
MTNPIVFDCPAYSVEQLPVNQDGYTVLQAETKLAARSASFVEAFCKLGLIPDTGGTYFLPRLLGSARATALAMLGDKLSAEQAAAWGLIWKCVDDAELMPTVQAMAAQLAQGPTLGYARTKQAIQAAERHALDAQFELEREFQRELGYTHDYLEGVTAFSEKRAPRFTGR